MRRSKHLRRVATLVVATLIAAACSSDGQRNPSATDAPVPSDAGDEGVPSLSAADITTMMGAAAGGLPADPHAAARALVRSILTAASDDAAIGAVAELLRRSGLPLTMGDGTVVGLPDDGGYPDVPVFAGFLRELSHSVRSGTVYPASLLAQVFKAVGATDAPIGWPRIAYSLAGWGKEVGDPAFVQSAASAVRALSGERGEPIIADRPAEQTMLDSLQMLLIVVHAAVQPVRRLAGEGIASGGPARAVMPRRQSSTVCQETRNAFEGNGAVVSGTIAADGALLNWLNTKTLEAVAADLDKGKPIVDTITGAGRYLHDVKSISNALGLLSYETTLMTLLGIEFTAQGVDPTHYKHRDGEHGPERTLSVSAYYHSGYSDESSACLWLLGIEIPKNGPLSNYGVDWTLYDSGGGAHTPAAGTEHLRAVNYPVQTGANKTDSHGEATLRVKPPVEGTPVGTGPVHDVFVLVQAKLTTDLFKFSDLIAYGNNFEKKAVFDRVWNQVKGKYVTRASYVGALTAFAANFSLDQWLPRRLISVPIKYHGPEPISISGTRNSIFLLFGSIRSVGTDIYSCEGPQGPWKGTSSFGGFDFNAIKTNMIDPWTSALHLPAIPDTVDPQSFSAPNFSAGEGTTTTVNLYWGVYADVTLYRPPPGGWPARLLADGTTGSVVGVTNIYGLLDNKYKMPFATVKVIVREQDKRCTSSESHWDSV